MVRDRFTKIVRCLSLCAVGYGCAALIGCHTPKSASEAMPLVPSNRPVIRGQAPETVPAIQPEQVPAIPREFVEPDGLPIPRTLVTPWKPPGIACPWPHDEWLHDGGDKNVRMNTSNEPAIRGLDLEDTVVEYTSACRGTCTEPSNRVHLYAPRFMAVRKVSSVMQNRQNEKLAGAEQPVAVVLYDEKQLADAAMQPIQPIADVGRKQPSISKLDQPAGHIIDRKQLAALQDRILPYENLQIIKFGIFEREEEAMLAERVQAAITWTHDKAVQVIIDAKQAMVLNGDQKAQATFTVDLPCNPRLRVVKVASTQVAKPGDIVEFTIRFDNTGDEQLNNITLLDNLTTRLEYVPDSAQASRDAEFDTTVNEGDSLVLRWTFADPLKPGDGGLVRFKCRVR